MQPRILETAPSPLVALQFSPRGSLLAAAWRDGQVWVWAVGRRALHPVVSFVAPEPIRGLSFHPVLSVLVTHGEGLLHFWRVPEGNAVAEVDAGGPEHLQMLPAGDRLLAATSGGTLRLLRSADGSPIDESPPLAPRILALAFCADAATVAVCCSPTGAERSGAIRFLALEGDALAPRPHLDLSWPDMHPASCAFGPRETLAVADEVLAICSLPGGVIQSRYGTDGLLLDAERAVPASPSPAGPWAPPVFSADGRLLVAGAPDGRIHLLDLARQRRVHTLEGHEGPIVAVALLHGLARAASAGQDGSVRLWDLAR